MLNQQAELLNYTDRHKAENPDCEEMTVTANPVYSLELFITMKPEITASAVCSFTPHTHKHTHFFYHRRSDSDEKQQKKICLQRKRRKKILLIGSNVGTTIRGQEEVTCRLIGPEVDFYQVSCDV